MAEVGGVITSQVDLLWSVALALLLAEVYLIGRFLEGGLALGCSSRILLVVSMVCQFASMSFGYLAYGAIVSMARCTPDNAGGVDEWCTRNEMTPASAFKEAEFMSLLQVGAFGFGLALFVILFVVAPRAVAAALKRG